LCMFLLLSCQKEDNTVQPEPGKGIPNIILDLDLGNSTDDAFALHALFALREERLCNIAGVMGNMKMEKAKDLLSRFLHYYNADDVPLGLVEGEEEYFEMVPYYQLVDSLKSDGTPLFEPSPIPLSERLPAWKLYRKLLSEAEDNSITIVSVGMFTNLGLLLDSQADEYSPLSGKELVSKKVKAFEVMAGCFSPVPLRYTKSGTVCQFLEVEYNIGGDVPMAKKVIQEWPGEMYIFPLEEGLRFPSVHDEILEAYRWQPDSPIYQIYSRYDEWAAGDVGQYFWDVNTVFHTVNSRELFLDSPSGFIHIDDIGKTDFTPDSKGNVKVISTNITCVHMLQLVFKGISQYSPKK